MYTPALVTFSFYSNESDKDLRFENLRSLDEQQRFTKEKLLNFSRSISAFNFALGGDSVSVPLADSNDIGCADSIRKQKGIDAYFAGVNKINGKSGWYYSGHALAVCLILSEQKNIPIPHDELLKSTKIIIYDEVGCNEFGGFIAHDFTSVIDKCDQSFIYLNELKSRINKLGRKKIFGIF
jgi:hypothetical protein